MIINKLAILTFPSQKRSKNTLLCKKSVVYLHITKQQKIHIMTQKSIIDHIDWTYLGTAIADRRKVKLAAKAVYHFCKSNDDVNPDYVVWSAMDHFCGRDLSINGTWVDHRTLTSKQVYDLLIKHLTANKSNLTYPK